jgi:hypothetical protein
MNILHISLIVALLINIMFALRLYHMVKNWRPKLKSLEMTYTPGLLFPYKATELHKLKVTWVTEGQVNISPRDDRSLPPGELFWLGINMGIEIKKLNKDKV